MLDVAILSIIAGLVVNTWIVAGLVVPMVVASGSMEPALFGPHRHWHCNGCACEFDRGLESLPSVGMAVCPHCGTANDVAEGTDCVGARVFVDRSTLAWRAPRRGETVVLQNPDEPSTLAVKRIAALPGDTVRIEKKGTGVISGNGSCPLFDGSLVLEPDEYYLLGDNGENSRDSRAWSPAGVLKTQIVGRAFWW